MKASIFCLTILALGFTNTHAAPKSATPNPALLGTTFLGPDPDYQCSANGAFPHPEKCDYFYDCWNGVATLGLCTEEQLFDLRFNGCNFANQVDCGDRERPPGSAPGPFVCPAPSGYFPDPTNCAAFYICENNVGFFHPCPFDHLYNPGGWCDYPQLVDCGDRPIPQA